MKYKFGDIIYNITEKRKPTEEDRLNYIGLEHLDSGSLFVNRWGAERTPEGEKIVMKKGDVLFGKRRAYQKKVAISPIDGVFSAHGMVLRPKENVICKEFLPFFISSDYFLNEAIRISVGGLSPTINWKDIKELEFNLPSIDEQKVLAEKLWAAYEVKQSYLKMIDAIDEMVKAQFIEMFGGIQDNTKWSLKKISDLCQLINGYAFKSQNYVDEGYSVIRISNVQKGYIDTSDKVYYPIDCNEDYKDSILQRGDILISLTGNVGRVGIVNDKHLPAVLNQRVQGLRIKNTEIDNQFLFSLLNLDIFEKLCINNASGSAQLNLSTIWLKELQIVCPPIQLQKAYAVFATQANKSKDELRKSIDAIDKVIKSLINENL